MPHQSFTCMACNSTEGTAALSDCRDYYLGTPHVVDYWKCARCSLLQQHPLPADTAAFYHAYPIHDRKSSAFNAARRILMGGSYYSVPRATEPLRLLDFGCGDGWFLDTCRKENLILMGFERDPGHAKRLTERLGIPVESDQQKLLTENAGTLDIITMNFVVEHLTHLDEAFSNAAKLLKPGGQFYFSVPNIDSLEARIFGKMWHGLDAPRHISFPNDNVVKLLATRHGLQLRTARHITFPPGIAGSLPVAVSGRFRYWLFLLFLPLALLINFLHAESARGYWLERE